MQKMAEDIINLRKDVARLEVENSKLRSELSSHQDLGRILLDDTDIDVMTKAEIADRIGLVPVTKENNLSFRPVITLWQKLATETAELLNCKDKVQQLQNELIRTVLVMPLKYHELGQHGVSVVAIQVGYFVLDGVNFFTVVGAALNQANGEHSIALLNCV
eukprot:g44938.t1